MLRNALLMIILVIMGWYSGISSCFEQSIPASEDVATTHHSHSTGDGHEHDNGQSSSSDHCDDNGSDAGLNHSHSFKCDACQGRDGSLEIDLTAASLIVLEHYGYDSPNTAPPEHPPQL